MMPLWFLFKHVFSWKLLLFCFKNSKFCNEPTDPDEEGIPTDVMDLRHEAVRTGSSGKQVREEEAQEVGQTERTGGVEAASCIRSSLTDQVIGLKIVRNDTKIVFNRELGQMTCGPHRAQTPKSGQRAGHFQSTRPSPPKSECQTWHFGNPQTQPIWMPTAIWRQHNVS